MTRRETKRRACRAAAMLLSRQPPEFLYLGEDGEALPEAEENRRTKAWHEIIKELARRGGMGVNHLP